MNVATDLPKEFSLEEQAWFHADGRMDETLTALTALESDEEFENWIKNLRLARSYSV